jgi:DNA-binding NarL/FixJ family response regulator
MSSHSQMRQERESQGAPVASSERVVADPSGESRVAPRANPHGDAGFIPLALGRFEPLVASGLRTILDEDQALRVVHIDVDDLVLEQLVAPPTPQVAILDEASLIGFSLLSRLRSAWPAAAPVVLAHRPTDAYGMRLRAAGASCIAKNASAVEIIDTVRRAAYRRRSRIGLIGAVSDERYHTGLPLLTARELEVLAYVSDRLTHQQIARSLHISIETARTHTKSIRRKLGALSNRELIGVYSGEPGDLKDGLSPPTGDAEGKRSPVSGDRIAVVGAIGFRPHSDSGLP